MKDGKLKGIRETARERERGREREREGERGREGDRWIEVHLHAFEEQKPGTFLLVGKEVLG